MQVNATEAIRRASLVLQSVGSAVSDADVNSLLSSECGNKELTSSATKGQQGGDDAAPLNGLLGDSRNSTIKQRGKKDAAKTKEVPASTSASTSPAKQRNKKFRNDKKDKGSDREESDEDEAVDDELTADERAQLQELLRSSNLASSFDERHSRHQRSRSGGLARVFMAIIFAVILIRIVMNRYKKPEAQ